ncbi:MAG: hypothetical protein WEC15_00535 [Flavobacteriales bacterium]
MNTTAHHNSEYHDQNTSLVAPVMVVKAVVLGKDTNVSGTRCHPLVRHTAVQFDALHELVEELGDQDYGSALPVLGKASLGMHLRHIMEFYITLMDAHGDVVDYDARPRDKALETDRHAALQKLAQLRDWLDHLHTDRPMTLLADHSLDGNTQERMATSLFRELAYGFDHGIHHMALLRIGVEQHFPHIMLDADFGVAPSTIRSRQCVR